MFRKDTAFLTKCYFVKYLIKISFNTSEEVERDNKWELLLEFGRTYTIAEENKKKSCIVPNLTGENWDLAFTI